MRRSIRHPKNERSGARRARTAASILVLVAACGFASADTHVVIERASTDEQSGAKDVEQAEVWIRGDLVRMDGKGNTFFADFSKNEFSIVDHDRKRYSVFDLPIDLASMLPEDQRAMFEQAVAQNPMNVEITPSDETREVGAWTGKKHVAVISNARGLRITNTMWTSTDAPESLASYERLTEVLSMLQPGGDWMREITAVPGVAVHQEVAMDFQGTIMRRVTETIRTVEERDAPEGNYAPPEDYVETPFDLMETIGR